MDCVASTYIHRLVMLWHSQANGSPLLYPWEASLYSPIFELAMSI